MDGLMQSLHILQEVSFSALGSSYDSVTVISDCLLNYPHVISHLEFVRNMKGQMFVVGLGIFKVSNKEDITEYFSGKNVTITFPDSYRLDKVHLSNIDAVSKLKEEWDPKKLLNPGKLHTESTDEASQ